MGNAYREADPDKFAELEAMVKNGATMWDFKRRTDLVAWIDKQALWEARRREAEAFHEAILDLHWA